MEIKIESGDLSSWKGDGIVVNLFEGATTPAGATGAVDKALGGLVSKLIASGDVNGKLNNAAIIHTVDKLPAARVCVVGLGKQNEFTPDRVRQASANGAKALRNAGAKKIATIVH